jgi:hypothetical protein
MASHSTEVLARMRRLIHVLPLADDDLIVGLEDMFHGCTDDRGEQEFLTGVSLFRTRTDTKMMIAGESAGGAGRGHPPVTAIVRPWHERDRELEHPERPADHRPSDHGGDQRSPAAVDQASGLVVSLLRPGLPVAARGAGEHGLPAAPLRRHPG